MKEKTTKIDENEVSMKPLLSVAIKEALRLAIKDVRSPGDIIDIDLDALGQALCCRLLGSDGWDIRGIYSGNASAQEILQASVENPVRKQTQDIVDALGLEDTEPTLTLCKTSDKKQQK